MRSRTPGTAFALSLRVNVGVLIVLVVVIICHGRLVRVILFASDGSVLFAVVEKNSPPRPATHNMPTALESPHQRKQSGKSGTVQTI